MRARPCANTSACPARRAAVRQSSWPGFVPAIHVLLGGGLRKTWMPAFAGMTWKLRVIYSRRMTNPSPESPIRFDPQAHGPLDGVRVLDLSRMVAGNML